MYHMYRGDKGFRYSPRKSHFRQFLFDCLPMRFVETSARYGPYLVVYIVHARRARSRCLSLAPVFPRVHLITSENAHRHYTTCKPLPLEATLCLADRADLGSPDPV